jgi:bacterioferritin
LEFRTTIVFASVFTPGCASRLNRRNQIDFANGLRLATLIQAPIALESLLAAINNIPRTAAITGVMAMKGEPKVIEVLNGGLTIELTAINQYFCQAKMCKNWGYNALAAKHYEESMGEMKHAEKLIDRILFLEGVPEIARYDVIRVGTDVREQLENDLVLETRGVKAYNDAIELCTQLKDNGTRELLDGILVESEEHVDWLETQLGIINEIGLQLYLQHQIGEETGEH